MTHATNYLSPPTLSPIEGSPSGSDVWSSHRSGLSPACALSAAPGQPVRTAHGHLATCSCSRLRRCSVGVPLARADRNAGHRNAGAGSCVAADTKRLVGRPAASPRTGRRRRIAIIRAPPISSTVVAFWCEAGSRQRMAGSCCRWPSRLGVNPVLAGGEARGAGCEQVARGFVLRPTADGRIATARVADSGVLAFALEVISLAKHHSVAAADDQQIQQHEGARFSGDPCDTPDLVRVLLSHYTRGETVPDFVGLLPDWG